MSAKIYMHNHLLGQTKNVERAQLGELSPEVAERIAAGEVIERPVSVVKELLENALDAGACVIRVEVRGGGLRLMRVTDDGDGIAEGDLARVCLRHTTSKIRTFEDLRQLHTLGFRGEALASIAAISEVTILSRAIETEKLGEVHAGVWITLRGAQIVERGRRARAHGTTVTVRDLFYNVPARLHYTRAMRTENDHVVQLLQRYAVGYPAVRFHLVVDERELLHTSGSGDRAIVLSELYHLSLSELLSAIKATDDNHYHMHGLIGNRVLVQSNRHYVMVFVNGRWVQSHSLQEALEQGYRSSLPKGKHPLLVLSLEVPPHEVDVNVHPGKLEIHLLQEKVIVTALTQAIKAVMEQCPAMPEAVTFPGPTLANQRRLPGPRRRGLHVAESAESYRAEASEPGTATVIGSLKPLAQLQQAVILAEAPDGSLYLVDQHRAHERVIYEHLCHTYVEVQAHEERHTHLLLEPVLIEMKRDQAERLEQRLPMLRGLGIECERFGGRCFLVRSVPTGEGSAQLAAHLQELVEVAAENATDWKDQLFIGLACRSALRRGRVLGEAEQKTLLKALAHVRVPAVCPHGSPILLHYSRMFLIDKFDW